MIVYAAGSMKAGTLIELTTNADGSQDVFPYSGANEAIAIGLLAHDAKKGDVLEFNPNGNTNDIIIRAIGVEINHC